MIEYNAQNYAVIVLTLVLCLCLGRHWVKHEYETWRKRKHDNRRDYR